MKTKDLKKHLNHLVEEVETPILMLPFLIM